MTTSQTLRVSIAVLVGFGLIVLAVMYFITPAGQLASFMPGFEAGSAHVHMKHGIGAGILAVLVFLYAWFASAKTVHAPAISDSEKQTPPTA